MLSLINKMIQKFKININQILANSDNTMEDITNEAFIVLKEHKDAIDKNHNIFINELRKRCLKFNKYGKRIDSKKQWEKFNDREEVLKYEYKNPLDINEDLICSLEVIKSIIKEKDYEFLLFYYNNDRKRTAERYSMTETQVRNKVQYLINKIRRKWKEVE